MLSKGNGFKNRGTGLKSGKGFKQTTSQLSSASKLKNSAKINHASSEQKAIDNSYAKNKKERYSQYELCTGCQETHNSTPSHLIPRSRRKDLIDVIENLKPHCLKCHAKWESSGRSELMDYEENMEIVKQLDPEYYRLLLMKQEMVINNQNSKNGKTNSKI